MKIEIELHEAQCDDGESVRIRVVREIRDAIGAAEVITLVRDHDSGLELRADQATGGYRDPEGRCYRVVRRLA